MLEAGYDVWLGNNRGNIYSREHRWYTTSDDQDYFGYSFQEFARYDLPAMINHVLSNTGHKSIAYIGHSQGTT